MSEEQGQIQGLGQGEAETSTPAKKVLPMPAILGQKIGMTQVFEGEEVVPVTVIKAGPCYISQLKTKEKDGYNAVQVAFAKLKKISKPVAGHLNQAKLNEQKFRYFREFKVGNLEGIALGEAFGVEILKAGDKVSVVGTSIGKGFAGTVKRHHFGRGPMAHGSKSHRLRGSSGSGTCPGNVHKGTRMAGRLGGARVTAKNLKVIRIDADRHLILLRGAVPGKENNLLEIRKVQK